VPRAVLQVIVEIGTFERQVGSRVDHACDLARIRCREHLREGGFRLAVEDEIDCGLANPMLEGGLDGAAPDEHGRHGHQGLEPVGERKILQQRRHRDPDADPHLSGRLVAGGLHTQPLRGGSREPLQQQIDDGHPGAGLLGDGSEGEEVERRQRDRFPFEGLQAPGNADAAGQAALVGPSAKPRRIDENNTGNGHTGFDGRRHAGDPPAARAAGSPSQHRLCLRG